MTLWRSTTNLEIRLTTITGHEITITAAAGRHTTGDPPHTERWCWIDTYQTRHGLFTGIAGDPNQCTDFNTHDVYPTALHLAELLHTSHIAATLLINDHRSINDVIQLTALLDP